MTAAIHASDDAVRSERRRFMRLAGLRAGGAAVLGAGLGVARPAAALPIVPASDVTMDILDQAAYGISFYPATMTLQEYQDSVLTHGLVIAKTISSGLPGSPSALEMLRSRAAFVTTYTAALPHNEVGTNGVNSVIVYGTPEDGASGYANAHNVYALVVNSAADPENPYGDAAQNEIGGTIAAMRMGTEGQEVPPRATFWGTSYTLRGGWRGQEPGGLGAYSAVMQNHFDGPGSRIDHYAYAAVTWPGIGDGDDFWSEPGEGDRYADTFAIPFGFIVAGQSGEWPDGGGIGYEVGVQSGGWATPWRGDRGNGYEDQRSKIGTGFRSIDWVTNGLHIGNPHPDADAGVASLLIDGSETTPSRPLLVRRTYSSTDVLVSEEPVVLSDGRVKAPALVDDDDAVSVQTLSAAYARVVGTSTDSLALKAHAVASSVSVAAGVPTLVAPLAFSSSPPASMYDLGSVTVDLGLGSATTSSAAVEVLLPGEYEATVWVAWDPNTSGTFRALSVMTYEDGASDPKNMAWSHIPAGLLAMGMNNQDAYQSSFRVRSDESGKQLFAVVMHDASSALDIDVSMLVRPVTFDAT